MTNQEQPQFTNIFHRNFKSYKMGRTYRREKNEYDDFNSNKGKNSAKKQKKEFIARGMRALNNDTDDSFIEFEVNKNHTKRNNIH